MANFANLPVGISYFERIREEGYLYVDKTRHIFRMVDEGIYYFLSRPRRFGKSLTVSTLKSLFEGKKEFFDGLWISENTGWQWKSYPVVLLDFNEISHDTPENLELSLSETLERIAEENRTPLKKSLLKDRFKELILALYGKANARVAVLVDEYDKPLIDHLGKGNASLEIAKKNREILRQFLGVLKGGTVSKALQFVFVTGVSKFSRVSIFSELNNLEDLTMAEDYADMLGYTKEELETYCAPHIEQFAEKEGVSPGEMLDSLERFYDGYRFSKRNVCVYNPFSTMCALKRKDLQNYWFETGTPFFLVNLLKEKNYPVARIENLRLDPQIFSVYDIERLQPEALLYQTGYITIEDVRDNVFSFRYPNREVKISFLKSLMYSHIPGCASDQLLFSRLSRQLERGDLEAFFQSVVAIFASIPNLLESKRDEAYFHTAFYLIVSAAGVNARSEVLTCEGRIDLVMEYDDRVYIVEFKCDQGADKALAQIREKAYGDPFLGSGKEIVFMGIDFDTEKRNVREWKSEKAIAIGGDE